MIYYLAGSPDLKQMEIAADKAHANHFLFTFAGASARKCAQHFSEQPQRRIFIDSGAFSIWSKGATVNLGKYIDFCKQIKSGAKCPVVFAALDVIPGKKNGPPPTPSEIERACDQGWDNYQTMKQEGIPCLMTFHQFEQKRWLTKIADDSDYFAVAPRKKGVSTTEKLDWLTNVFDYLKVSTSPRDKRKKIHGLGVSSPTFMTKFPFYSVDNTGWVQSVRSYSRATLYDVKTTLTQFKHWEEAALSGRIVFEMEEGAIAARMFLALHAAGALESLERRSEAIPALRKALGYPAADDKCGVYWLMYTAMYCAAETEWRITKLWQRKGVSWPDQGPTTYNFDTAKREDFFELEECGHGSEYEQPRG